MYITFNVSTYLLLSGNIIHTQKYKDPEEFRDRRVLLVGAGASGLDLATHLSNVTSRLVHSHHLRYNQPYFGESYVKKPDIKMFTSTGVVFQDDSYEEIDDVILATGKFIQFVINMGTRRMKISFISLRPALQMQFTSNSTILVGMTNQSH